jgi:glycosyltransferase involved in cell wall biosynthesis
VKTGFHIGWEALERYGGEDHPFIIAMLGSVVAPTDREGVYFYGDERAAVFEVQKRIAERARYVTILTPQSLERWGEAHGLRGNELLVPGGADAEAPPPGPDPFPDDRRPACVFAGNFYDAYYQAEVHATLIDKIGRLGHALRDRGLWLHIVGRGDSSGIDPDVVVCHSAVSLDRAWDFIRFADAGMVFAFGWEPNDNESTKIYHYLRAGLPTVCESGFPNEGLVVEAGIGSVVSNDDMEGAAEALAAAVTTAWDRDAARDFVLANHTWDARARIYDRLIRRELPALTPPGSASR